MQIWKVRCFVRGWLSPTRGNGASMQARYRPETFWQT